MKPVRVGLIGAGEFSQYCLEAYQSLGNQVSFLAVADSEISKAKNLAKVYQIPVTTATADEIIKSPEIDLVIILMPPDSHYSLAKKALQHGKHVLVEKPMAFTQKEARELFSLATEKQLRIASNLILRYHPFHQQIRQWNKDKKFGKLVNIFTTALLAKYPAGHWYWDERVSGGFFLNTYCHFLDLNDFIINQDIQTSGHIGHLKTGQLIYQQYPHALASLAINLTVNNEQERVETVYVFEHCAVRTSGWLPEKMELIPEKNKSKLVKAPAKDYLYQSILAEILGEVVNDINEANRDEIQSHNFVPFNAVVGAIKAQNNQITNA